jgi:hypothetical protein
MARSPITEISEDLIEDAGSILWSVIQGEQLEFPVALSFLSLIDNTYTIEAVIIEGENDGLGTVPTTINQTDPIKDTLTVRLPVYHGVWNPSGSYVLGEYVSYGTAFYYLFGNATVGLVPSDDSDNWELFTPNRIYVQFDSTLSTDYDVTPTVDTPIYGFFELAVTEPISTILQKTWKPVRGLVQFRFSPTSLVP